MHRLPKLLVFEKTYKFENLFLIKLLFSAETDYIFCNLRLKRDCSSIVAKFTSIQSSVFEKKFSVEKENSNSKISLRRSNLGLLIKQSQRDSLEYYVRETKHYIFI